MFGGSAENGIVKLFLKVGFDLLKCQSCADVRKAEHFLGYRSKVSFEDGIQRTVQWYKATYGSQNDKVVRNEKASSAVVQPQLSVVV